MLMSLIKSWLNLVSNILWSLSHLQGIGSRIPMDAKILRCWVPAVEGCSGYILPMPISCVLGCIV